MSTHRIIHKTVLFLLVTLLCQMVGPAPAGADWYVPVINDFRPAYDADKENQRYQKWDGENQYWWWVQKFYNGYTYKMFGRVIYSHTGWTQQGSALLREIHGNDSRNEVQALLNEVGRMIAREWAKDNRVRKINNNDLRSWGDMIKESQQQDDGSGASIKRAILAVRSKVQRKLA